VLSTNQKGALAEVAIAKRAIELEIEIYRPVAEGGRFDLIFAFDYDDLARVQCKYAPVRDGVLDIRSYSSRRTRSGCIRRHYTAQEIDALATFCPSNGCCYYLPMAMVSDQGQIRLRVDPAKSCQDAGINWATA